MGINSGAVFQWRMRCLSQEPFYNLAKARLAPCDGSSRIGPGAQQSIEIREWMSSRSTSMDWCKHGFQLGSQRRQPRDLLPEVPASQPQNLSAYSTSPSHTVSYTSLIVSWDALPAGECIFTGWKVETSVHGQAAEWKAWPTVAGSGRAGVLGVPGQCTAAVRVFHHHRPAGRRSLRAQLKSSG